MLIPFFYVLNIILLLSWLLMFRMASDERLFSFSLIQTLAGLPLLAGEYIYFACNLTLLTARMVFFSEIVFALIWIFMALRLHGITVVSIHDSRLNPLIEIIIVAVVSAMVDYFLLYHSATEISKGIVVFHHYGPVYFSAVFILMTVLYASWRMEEFWRSLNTAWRREYKFLIVGGYLICGALAWAASYRLTYLTIVPRHLMLMAVLLSFGWLLMFYAVIRHRLLNRKIFISRKVVYSFIVPSFLAAYLLCFGIVSLIMRTFGLQLSFVLKWLFVALGFVVVGLFAFSGKMRRSAHYFISTHFYINKYEYRDEWLALSHYLHGALTEVDVVIALQNVLAESLYTTEIFIWLGDSLQGYNLVSFPENPDVQNKTNIISSNDPLVKFIENHSHFYVKEKNTDAEWLNVMKTKESFLRYLNITLLAPISIGSELVGLIGLGPEFTGGQYGYDDFDLLTVLGSQTASALMAVRMAEKLAYAREQQAWNRLSAFVLHDIKNAATMLSLLQENAPEHIHESEFQQDMLELVDDTLKRMGSVEQSLNRLKDGITPALQNLELGRILDDFQRRTAKKFSSIEINIEHKGEIQVSTDPELLFIILENLLLNTFEACKEMPVVHIKTMRDNERMQAVVKIIDNGPGIAKELLPDILFEPFKTDKDGGSGIGLWQVKKIVTSLSGSISAENSLEGGARFVLRLPLAIGVG